MGWECQNCHSFFVTRKPSLYIHILILQEWLPIPDIGREVPWGNADPRIIEQLFAAAGAGMSPFEQGRLGRFLKKELWPLEVQKWRDGVFGRALTTGFALFVFFSFLRLWAPRRRRSKPKPEIKETSKHRKTQPYARFKRIKELSILIPWFEVGTPHTRSKLQKVLFKILVWHDGFKSKHRRPFCGGPFSPHTYQLDTSALHTRFGLASERWQTKRCF